jgi:hypothetical protein
VISLSGFDLLQRSGLTSFAQLSVDVPELGLFLSGFRKME